MIHDCFFQSIFNFASRWEVILFHNSNDNADNDLDIEKDVFVLSRAWDKEKILSPHEESTLRPSDSALRCSTIELQGLHGEDGMVSFELGKEIEKDVFRLVISCRYHLLLQFPVFKI